jgi:hypothetical protein
VQNKKAPLGENRAVLFHADDERVRIQKCRITSLPTNSRVFAIETLGAK